MIPSFTKTNDASSCEVNRKLSAKAGIRSATLSKLANLNHLALRKLPGRIFAALLDAVAQVVLLGTNKEVFRITAIRNVATVAHTQSIWDRSVKMLPSGTMDTGKFTINPDLRAITVTRLASGRPKPAARIRLDYFTSKEFTKRDAAMQVATFRGAVLFLDSQMMRCKEGCPAVSAQFELSGLPWSSFPDKGARRHVQLSFSKLTCLGVRGGSNRPHAAHHSDFFASTQAILRP